VQQEVFDMLAPQSPSRLAAVFLELLDATQVRQSRVGGGIAQIECTVESVLDLLRHE
jgi:flavin reductase (DIM6/NTAB) family NADH-FMN oxidoreductase RutF